MVQNPFVLGRFNFNSLHNNPDYKNKLKIPSKILLVTTIFDSPDMHPRIGNICLIKCKTRFCFRHDPNVISHKNGNEIT